MLIFNLKNYSKERERAKRVKRYQIYLTKLQNNTANKNKIAQ